MKRFLLWSFNRGSIQYEVICGIILALIFLLPPTFFHDLPPYMRISSEPLHLTVDDSGNTVFTVQLDTPAFSSDEVNKGVALELLRKKFGEMQFSVTKWVPIYTTWGRLRAYAVWVKG